MDIATRAHQGQLRGPRRPGGRSVQRRRLRLSVPAPGRARSPDGWVAPGPLSRPC